MLGACLRLAQELGFRLLAQVSWMGALVVVADSSIYWLSLMGKINFTVISKAGKEFTGSTMKRLGT